MINVKRRIVFLCCLWSGLTIACLVYSVEPVKPTAIGHSRVFIAIARSPENIKDWVKKTTVDDILRFKNAERFVYGQRFCAAFIVTGDILNADFSVDYKVIAPDGTIVFNETNCAQVKASTDSKLGFMMALPPLTLMFDDDKPAGRYLIQAIAKDKVSKKIAQEKVAFQIESWDPALVENQKKYFSFRKANQFFQKGDFERAAWHALSLYPVDRKSALQIGQELRSKVDFPIQDFLFKVYRQSMGSDPSIRLSEQNYSIVGKWLQQKADWCDLFIRDTSTERKPTKTVFI